MEENAADEAQITFNIKSSSEAKYVLTLPENTTVLDLKTKLSTSEYADIPVERQRLIYSGRVLKDNDTLGSYKIKDGHTVHLVKGAASNQRQNPANQGSSVPGSSSPAVPTNIAAGTGNNPLAALTGARYAGFHPLPGAEMFGPDGGMGPLPDQDQMLRMMNNPMFLSQMNEAMNNPAVIQMMRDSPMLRNNPMARMMLDNPEFRRLMTNPDVIRAQIQMNRAMGGGLGGDGASAFPAPGMTDNTPQSPSAATGGGTTATPNQPNTTGPTHPPQSPFPMFGNMPSPGAGPNPFAALFGNPSQAANPAAPSPSEATTGQTPGTSQPDNSNAPNPLAGLFGNLGSGADAGAGAAPQGDTGLGQMMQRIMENPETMRSVMQMASAMGMGTGAGAANPGGLGAGLPFGNIDPNNAAANPFAGLFNPGAFGAAGAGATPPAPPDNRPPEERYAEQLRQLNDMGFFDFERNVTALRRSGGSVQGAVEYLLSGS